METLPSGGTFTDMGVKDFPGRAGPRVLYAWGDFGGGRLVVEAIVPHPDGDEIFAADDEVDYLDPISDEDPDLPEVGQDPDPAPVFSLSDKGFVKIPFIAPTIRVSLIECIETPNLKYWMG